MGARIYELIQREKMILTSCNAGSGHGEIRKIQTRDLVPDPGASLFGSFLDNLCTAQSTRYIATKKTFYAQPSKCTAHMKIMIHGWFWSKNIV
jgi:hypothetical protein